MKFGLNMLEDWDGIGLRFAVSMKTFVMREAVDDQMVRFGVDCGGIVQESRHQLCGLIV
jgi:hypothetical protein